MEIKKTPKADLQNKKGLLLEIGLVISLGLMIVAFLYTPKEYRIVQPDLEYGVVEDVMTDITRQQKEKPQPPKKIEIKAVTTVLKIVANDTKVTTDMSFLEFEEDIIIEPVAVEEEEIEDDQPFLRVEAMPTFQGGDLNTFRNWVQKNVKFPQIALENGIQGRVVLSFVIERNGKLTNIQVLQTPDRSLSEEASRVLAKSPVWAPGKQRNKAVRVKYTLPVEFRVAQ